jgi:hypothetical protein
MASIPAPSFLINDNNLLYQKLAKNALFPKKIHHLLVNDQANRIVLSGEILIDNLKISIKGFVFRANE